MKLRIGERSESKLHEGDYELFSEPEYIGPYGDDGWETDDDDHYNFKQLGLRTVRDVVDFYKDLSKRRIVSRYCACGVLGDIDWNVRHGYWDGANTQAVIDALDSDPSFKFYGESLKRNKSKRLREVATFGAGFDLPDLIKYINRVFNKPVGDNVSIFAIDRVMRTKKFEDYIEVSIVKDKDSFSYGNPFYTVHIFADYIDGSIVRYECVFTKAFDDNVIERYYQPVENYAFDKIRDKIEEFVHNHIENVTETYKRLKEQDVEIEVKHEGILEVPEGKNVDDLPLSHFEKLAKKKGLGKITKALNNLQVWNKNDDPKLSKWAGNMIDKLNKKLKKDESISRKRFNEGWHNGDAIITFTHNDDLEADLEEFLFDLFSDNPDVFDFDWSGRTTKLYLACSEDDYKYIKWFIEDWKYKHRDEYDESLKEDYITVDGISYDEYEIYRKYHDLIRSDKVDALHGIYYDVGGNEDEFIIDAIDRGFSKLDIMSFLMYAVEDSLSLREIKGLFKSLNISLKESSMYDYYDVPDGAFDMHNDMPTEEDEMWSELSTKQREIINALEELGYNGNLTRFFSKIIGSWTKVYDTDKSTSSGVEITVDLDGKVTVQEFVYSVDEEDLTDLSPVKVVKSATDVKKLDSWAKRIKKRGISL